MPKHSNDSNSATDSYIWINPDGTEGGRVSRKAKIDPSAIIEKYAIVTAGTIVGPDETVIAGTLADGSNRVRFGPPIDLSRIKPASPKP